MQLIIKLIEQTIPLVGSTSKLGQALLSALKDLSKEVQPGQVSPATENNQIEALRMRQLQMGPQMAALRQQGAVPGGAPGGPPQQPMPPGGGAPGM